MRSHRGHSFPRTGILIHVYNVYVFMFDLTDENDMIISGWCSHSCCSSMFAATLVTEEDFMIFTFLLAMKVFLFFFFDKFTITMTTLVTTRSLTVM